MKLSYFSLAFLSLLVVTTATPTFTWSVLGNLIPSSQPDSCTCSSCVPLTYVNALYYWTVEVASCFCNCPNIQRTVNLIQGPQDLDSVGVLNGWFTLTPPTECDIGTDATIMCKQ